MSYDEFLAGKAQFDGASGVGPVWMPDCLFPFQMALTEWALCMGRAGLFEDCGMGKTLQQLVWAENVRRVTGRPVLGVGSEVYAAVEMSRVGIGVELKPSYYRQAAKNLAALGNQHCEQSLLELMGSTEPIPTT